MQEKSIFRNDLAQLLSIIKVNFIFEAIKRQNHGKATIVDPARFKEKLENLEQKE